MNLFRPFVQGALIGVGAASLASLAPAAEPAQVANTGEVSAHVSAGHDLTGKAAALARLYEVRAATAHGAYRDLEPVVPSGGAGLLNTGGSGTFVFRGHDLTRGPSAAEGGTKILYCPSEADDPAYRAAIAAAAGGATVDYFDARAATPDVPTLLQYDAVYTWANFAYADNVLLGDNLAAYNDQGGTVILGVFCTYTSGNFLSGKIMTADYSPVVSPTGSNHFSSSTYTGGGTSCIYAGVSTLECGFRDVLALQGSGVADGFYADGEVTYAYRGTATAGKGDVVYSNGCGGVPISGTGEWAVSVANAATCNVAGPTMLYAPSEADDAAYRAAISAAAGGATVDYFDAAAGTPSLAMLQTYTAVHTWANFPYADKDGFGNSLADYVDVGGDVVLGTFCTYTSGNSLGGKIMTPAYSPVISPNGTNHFLTDADGGPYFSCLTDGVVALGAFYRDELELQGDGIVDSKYDTDAELATAYRVNPGGAAGDVVYANGSGGAQLAPTGDWPEVIANAVLCDVGSQGSPSSCTLRPGVLGLNPQGFSCVTTPIVGDTWMTIVDTAPSIGSITLATYVALGIGGPTQGLVIFGYELLILPPVVLSTGLGTHSIPIPAVADFIGAQFSFQGARFESNPSALVLTNAQDIVIGL